MTKGKRPMSNILILPEGHYLDDMETVISTNFVDVRDIGNRTPIAGLIKSSPEAYAIPHCGTVHVGTLKYYREHEDPRIRDPGEGYASRVRVRQQELTDDPVDVRDSQLLIEARNRGDVLAAAELRGEAGIPRFNVTIKQGTITTRTRRKSKSSITYGKNGWIFCATIIPHDRQEHAVWQHAMRDRRCTSLISSPRNFARALASMTADQLGPQCKEVHWQGKFGEHDLEPRCLRSQTVFHGPVIYTADVYKVISSASSDLERILLPVFTKHTRYCDEREYRFFIFAKEEPNIDWVNLRVPAEVMATIETFVEDDWLQDLPPGEKTETPVPNDESSDKSKVSDTLDTPWDPLDPFDLLNDPSVAVAPMDYTALGLPDDLEEITSVYSAVQALRQSVERVSVVRRVDVSSAAWYAEAFVRRLCTNFENPIAGIAISDSNDIVIRLNFPPERESFAAAVVSPQGTTVCRIQRPTGVEVKHDEGLPLLRDTTLKRFAELGLALRSTSSNKKESDTP